MAEKYKLIHKSQMNSRATVTEWTDDPTEEAKRIFKRDRKAPYNIEVMVKSPAGRVIWRDNNYKMILVSNTNEDKKRSQASPESVTEDGNDLLFG